MYSFFVKPNSNKKTMGLVHSIIKDSVTPIKPDETSLEVSEKRIIDIEPNLLKNAPVEIKQHYPPGTQENYNSFLSRNIILEKVKELECTRRAGGLESASRIPMKGLEILRISEEPGVPPKIKMGPALFTLRSMSKDIEYPTSNSILKTEDNYKSTVFTSEVYESCVLSFSIIEIMENISVGLINNDEKYYGINFQTDKCFIDMNEDMESDVEFCYEIGDNFKIIHLSNEINIFKNELKIYTSRKNENDSCRALFTLFNKEDEIGNIQFYYIHQCVSSCINQGSNIILTDPISNDIKISEGNSFYLLKGVSSIISGITKGKNGQYIILINDSGNKQIFLNNDKNSLPENRLYLGGNKIEIKNQCTIKLLYVSDLKKWVIL